MKKEMKPRKITSIKDVLNYERYNEDEKKDLDNIIKNHPMLIPEYYYDLINFNDEEDPVRKQAIPSLEEKSVIGEIDTSGEQSNTKFPGLQHKYQRTVLVLATNICFMYCRHCFRKRMVGYSNEEIMQTMEEAVEYVKMHQEVNNVLITGGDVFTMANMMIEQYLDNFSQIKHLDFIRFGTRSLVVYPKRIYDDKKLLEILKKYGKKKEIIVVTHFNHEKEITEESTKAVKALKDIGVIIRNQTVLLKGVNDDSYKLANLLNKLVSIGVHPYYVFQCRPVKGATHFQVPINQAIDIFNGARKMLNGISKACRFVMSHKLGKIEILDKTEEKLIFKFHQSKFLENDNKLFFRSIDYKSTWLDIDLNLINP